MYMSVLLQRCSGTPCRTQVVALTSLRQAAKSLWLNTIRRGARAAISGCSAKSASREAAAAPDARKTSSSSCRQPATLFKPILESHFNVLQLLERPCEHKQIDYDVAARSGIFFRKKTTQTDGNASSTVYTVYGDEAGATRET